MLRNTAWFVLMEESFLLENRLKLRVISEFGGLLIYYYLCDRTNFFGESKKVDYDFKYYKMEIAADAQVLILSEGKSNILPADVILPFHPQSPGVSEYMDMEALKAWRCYLATFRSLQHYIDSDMQKFDQRQKSMGLPTSDDMQKQDLMKQFMAQVRQKKDVLGCCVFHLLSSYILIYSGGGPCKLGIRRDIDEALRPGIYALIDACSVDDLQRMHTVFRGKKP